jgi:hypothetical protein
MKRFFFAVAATAMGFSVQSALGYTSGTFQQAGQGACPAVPSINASFVYLLTDGTVMVQDQSNKYQNWYRLAPDNTGSYACGTWTQLASIPNSFNYGPRFYSGAVLPDGRFAIQGGEYNLGNPTATDTNLGAIYLPTTNQWLPLRPPPGWTQVGDAQSVVLPNGQWIAANSQTSQQALFNASNLTWTPTGSNFDPTANPNVTNTNDEAGWTLLPDGSVFTVNSNMACLVAPGCPPFDINSATTYAQRWIAGNLLRNSTSAVASNKSPTTIGTWYSAGSTNTQLYDTGVEMGPQVLLPATPANQNGTVLVLGATGNVAVYTPPPLTNPPSTLPGSWANTTKLPATCGASGTLQCGANDVPAVLLPSGNVLLFSGPAATGPTKGGTSTCPASCEFPAGALFFEFSGGVWNPVSLTGAAAPLATQIAGDPSWVGAMLLLPNGQVMFTDGLNGGSNKVWMYTPLQGSPSPAWAPTITSYPTVITRNQTYNIYGYLFNGMSQASYYGDDYQNATNYPIVQVTMDASPNHIYYGRTHDHSSMGVAQMTLPVSTKFELWDCAHQIAGSACVNETGPATLVVIANGIPSVPVNVTIQ